MSVYLQFDSSSRSNAYITKDLGAGVVWVPNDNYDNAINECQLLDENIIILKDRIHNLELKTKIINIKKAEYNNKILIN